MKKLITTLFLSACMVVAMAQSPAKKEALLSTHLTTASSRTGMGFNSAPTVTIWSDGTIEVQGDSLTAIKGLIKTINYTNESNANEIKRLYRQIKIYEDGLVRLSNILNPKKPIKKK